MNDPKEWPDNPAEISCFEEQPGELYVPEMAVENQLFKTKIEEALKNLGSSVIIVIATQ